MIIPLEQFDISKYDSSVFGPRTPELLLSKLLSSIQYLSEANLNYSVEQRTETKLRAALNTLVHEGRKQAVVSKENSSKSSISYFLPRLSEIIVTDDKNLDLVLIQNKLVIFAPKLEESSIVAEFISSLNSLSERSKGAKTWILDLSLVSKIPFELFGYLIGLKMALDREQIELELMWLTIDAVPQELLESMQSHFKLYCKGAFLLSKINNTEQQAKLA